MATPPSYAVPDLVAEVSRLMIEHPMADAVIEEIDGRRIQVDGHWLVDFASCNYLGLDLDLEVITQVPAYLARWGTHPSWARAIASPEPYRRVESVVSELLGVEDILAFPTLTHTPTTASSRPSPARARSCSTRAPTGPSRTPPPSPPPAAPPSGASAPATSSTPGGCSRGRSKDRGCSAWTASTR